MASQLPSDPVVLEQTLVGKIRDTFLSVELIQRFAQVHGRERFPDNDTDDKELTTVADPLQPALSFTSVIEIGIPTVEEFERTNDKHTQLNFVYPIKFVMGVHDFWDDPEILYNNSRALFMAIYMKARQRFKGDPSDNDARSFGYDNCSHEYLQQDFAGTLDDEESGSQLHVADWSLTVKCTSIF